jgi:hypothetical protein
MAMPASDNFNRAAIGTGWTNIAGGIVIVSSTTAQGSGASTNSAYWNADTPGADQFARCTVASGGGDDGPACRMVADDSFYYLDIRYDGIWHLAKRIAGTNTELASGTGIAFLSIFEVRAVGTTITGWDDGAQLGTNQTDSAIASGRFGVMSYGTTGHLDDFYANNYPETPPYVSPDPLKNYLSQQQRAA